MYIYFFWLCWVVSLDIQPQTQKKRHTSHDTYVHTHTYTQIIAEINLIEMRQTRARQVRTLIKQLKKLEMSLGISHKIAQFTFVSTELTIWCKISTRKADYLNRYHSKLCDFVLSHKNNAYARKVIFRPLKAYPN